MRIILFIIIYSFSLPVFQVIKREKLGFFIFLLDANFYKLRSNWEAPFMYSQTKMVPTKSNGIYEITFSYLINLQQK